MNATLLIATFGVLVAALVMVSLIRWNVGQKEDDHLHVMDSEKELIGVQSNIAHRLDVLDRWRKILLIATVMFGIAILALHMYSTFTQTAVPLE
jgi:hypothetical protein